MTDAIDRQRRSENMAAIKRKDTTIEQTLRSALWASGLRGYRLDVAAVPGRPDIVFSRGRVAIFVDGCFWHRCPECYREPKSNTDYWRAKAERNVTRDRAVDQELLSAGWQVVRLWEHEIERDLSGCVVRIRSALR